MPIFIHIPPEDLPSAERQNALWERIDGGPAVCSEWERDLSIDRDTARDRSCPDEGSAKRLQGNTRRV